MSTMFNYLIKIQKSTCYNGSLWPEDLVLSTPATQNVALNLGNTCHRTQVLQVRKPESVVKGRHRARRENVFGTIMVLGCIDTVASEGSHLKNPLIPRIIRVESHASHPLLY